MSFFFAFEQGRPRGGFSLPPSPQPLPKGGPVVGWRFLDRTTCLDSHSGLPCLDAGGGYRQPGGAAGPGVAGEGGGARYAPATDVGRGGGSGARPALSEGELSPE